MKLKTLSINLNLVRTLLEGEEVAPTSEMIIISYVEDIKSSLSCQPLTVCCDGTNYWLFDGYHRLEAMKRIGFNTCLVKVYKGSRRDALRRYICDKLKSKGTGARNVVKHCVGLLCEDLVWKEMKTTELSKLFQRKAVFFQNLEEFRLSKWDAVSLSANKHGTMNLMKRRRS